MTDTMLNNRKVEVAARINGEVDRIKTVQLQLNVLRNQGILVDLSVSGTGSILNFWCGSWLFLNCTRIAPGMVTKGWIDPRYIMCRSSDRHQQVPPPRFELGTC
jgi:hypothetical protein